MLTLCVRSRALALPFLAVVFAAIFATAAPAPAPKPPAAPKPPEQVTVKKADGTSVSGELLTADRDALSVRPGKADAILIPWKQVASVSNGLTRQFATLRWRASRAGLLCPQCIGERVVKHEACNGTGIDPDGRKECATCKGTGSGGKCTNAKCVNGKVDCPGPCLKLSVGIWKPQPDGTKHRDIPLKGGRTAWISSGHVGQVWGPNAEGTALEQKGPCPVCASLATYDCPTCDGKGHLPCKACNGAGFMGKACKDCDHGKAKCETCMGKGAADPQPGQ